MSASWYAVVASALVAVGLYGFIVQRHILRRVMAFNVMGSGIFLLLGTMARRGDPLTDPVPQALVITGIVVALAATALAVALLIVHARVTSRAALAEDDE